jgi:hypothetical protein
MTEMPRIDQFHTSDNPDADLCDRGARVRNPSRLGWPVDDRYRRLLSQGDWSRLPCAVQQRFAKRPQPGTPVVYRGEIQSTTLSRRGWALAQLARLIGSPLPLEAAQSGTAAVVIIPDRVRGGEIWTRIYERKGRFSQVIASAKRFQGPTGLEEHLGFGLVMRLVLSVDQKTGALVFASDGFDLKIGRRRLPLPRWLAPLSCEVRHRDLGDKSFEFELLVALRSQTIISQRVVFRDECRTAD